MKEIKKIIKKELTVYEAEDGTIYQTKKACEEHEYYIWKKDYQNKFKTLDYLIIGDVNGSGYSVYLIKIHNQEEWNIAQVYFQDNFNEVVIDDSIELNEFPFDLVVTCSEWTAFYDIHDNFTSVLKRYQNIIKRIDKFKNTK